jgi:hypothetical protein
VTKYLGIEFRWQEQHDLFRELLIEWLRRGVVRAYEDKDGNLVIETPWIKDKNGNFVDTPRRK